MDTINYVYPVNLQNKGAVKVYPNPSNGRFTIELPEGNTQSTIEIIDIYGRNVKTIKNNAINNNKIPIEFEGLQSGSYLIKIVTEDYIYRNKIEIW